MVSFNPKVVDDYILGNDILEYSIDELENDFEFMKAVIYTTKDKKMYDFCSDNLQSNPKFIQFLIETFSDDQDFLIEIINKFFLLLPKNIDGDLTKIQFLYLIGQYCPNIYEWYFKICFQSIHLFGNLYSSDSIDVSKIENLLSIVYEKLNKDKKSSVGLSIYSKCLFMVSNIFKESPNIVEFFAQKLLESMIKRNAYSLKLSFIEEFREYNNINDINGLLFDKLLKFGPNFDLYLKDNDLFENVTKEFKGTLEKYWNNEFVMALERMNSCKQSEEVYVYYIYNMYNLDVKFDYYMNEFPEYKEQIIYILDKYKVFKNNGNFEKTGNAYNCSIYEIDSRVSKLKEVSEIINSNITDFKKAEKLIDLYPSAKIFKRSYGFICRRGKEDIRFDHCRDILNNFDFLYDEYNRLDQEGKLSTVKYLRNIKSYIANYDYANYVINCYIDSDDSYKLQEFYSKFGIDGDIFDFCVDTIHELNVDLYNSFLTKQQENKKTRLVKISKTIHNLAEGIRTGYLENGTPFDFLIFAKMVPFKKSWFFLEELLDFTRNVLPDDYRTIKDYTKNNNINDSTFSKYNITSYIKDLVSINDRIFTESELNIIVDYLKYNGIPVVHKTFLVAKDKYLNGEITADSVSKLKTSNYNLYNDYSVVLIPSLKK